jgi:hypothetical protein
MHMIHSQMHTFTLGLNLNVVILSRNLQKGNIRLEIRYLVVCGVRERSVSVGLDVVSVSAPVIVGLPATNNEDLLIGKNTAT